MSTEPNDFSQRKVLLGIVWVVFGATVLFRLTVAEWHGDLPQVPVLLVAGGGAWLGGRQRSGWESVGWRSVGAAWLISALGALVWFGSRWAQSPTLEAFGSILWNLYYPLMAGGLALLATRPQGEVRMARATVEALTTGIGCAVLVYYFVGRHSEVDAPTFLAAAVGDTLVLTTAALLLSRDRTEPGQRLLGMGAMLATLSDLSSVYAPPGSWWQLFAGMCLFLSSALIGTAGLVKPGLRRRFHAPLEVTLAGMAHLPSASTVTVLGVVMIEATSGQTSSMVVLACGLGAMLALLLLGLALTRYAAELEEDLRAEQTERLSAAQRFMAFGQFAGAAVHDLNNMIVVLHSVAAELRVRDPVSPEVEDLEAATARAATVCREMLTFGRREEVLGAIDPGAVVQGLESLLRRTVTRSLVLEVLMPSEPLPVLAERGQLEMALLNLVANARDATKKGLVTVELARRSVTPDDWFGKQAVAAGSWVALSVRDTGTGMSAEVQANVFRPFFTTKGARGTGLGLAQVADFAQKSGGHVLIDSTPGRGTVVWVLLRAA